MRTLQQTGRIAVLGILLTFAVLGTAQAALVNFTITGDINIGDEFFPNNYGLTAGDTISATGTFDDSGLTGAGGTITFGSVNTLSIDLNGTVFTQNDDLAASLTFSAYSAGVSAVLDEFDYLATVGPDTFSSLFLNFDDGDSMIGTWRSNVDIQPVPVPAAVWLFGSGLLGLVGIARRKRSA